MQVEEDAVARAEVNESLIQRCMSLVDACCSHMSQFPSSVFVSSEHMSYNEVKTNWLEGYYSMNEQVLNADKFSVSDLLFVTLCYIRIAQNPSLRECSLCDQDVESTLNVLRFMGSQHTPETVTTWPSLQDISLTFDHVA